MISVITIGMKRLGAKHAFFSFNRLFSSTTDEIFHRCESLYQSILPLNHKLFGPLEDATERNTAMPFVFLLGNHSSGKSSFINYLLGKEVRSLNTLHDPFIQLMVVLSRYKLLGLLPQMMDLQS